MAHSASKTRILTEGAILVALATVLSFVKIPLWPHGGSITLLSMLPILMMSFRRGAKWGTGTAFVYAIIQMMIGFENLSYCATLTAQILCVLLDYVVAFTVLGTADLFSKFTADRLKGAETGTVIVCAIRFVCHFLSGIILWGSYAPEGWHVWIYSLFYNGSYMLVETVLCYLGILLIYRKAPSMFEKQV